MFDQIFQKLVGQAVQGLDLQDPRLRRYIPWATELLTVGVSKWGIVAESGFLCDIKLRGKTTGDMVTCKLPAVGACVVCSDSCCLDHALVKSDGTVICMACVNAAKISYKRSPGERGSVESPEDKAELQKKYQKRLGLEPSEKYTKEEIKAAYKKLAVKYHPDKAKTDEQREKFTKKSKELNEAYHWLTK
jgi:hypothetical protein